MIIAVSLATCFHGNLKADSLVLLAAIIFCLKDTLRQMSPVSYKDID